MSPSPAERFSSLLARSGERGWTPADGLGDEGPSDGFGEVPAVEYDCGDQACEDEECEDEPGRAGVRPGLSRTVLLCLLGAALTGVLVLLLAPSLLRGGNLLAGQDAADDWESAQAEATPDTGEAAPDTGETGNGPQRLVVHVVGAVEAPGVVDLPSGSRVSDALEAVGGATGDAAVESVNLARVLVDGEQIRVPESGDEAAAAGPPEADGTGAVPPGPGAAGPEVGDAAGALVDLNTADLAALETLPGIGPVTAQSIVDHREAVGRFSTVDELLDVSGIGDATLGRIRDSVTVG